MPTMSHAIEGRPNHPTPKSTPRSTPGRTHRLPTGRPDEPGLWKYRSLTRSSGVVALSVFVSIGLHALVLLGFNQPVPVVRQVIVDDGPLVQMTMPDLQDDDEVVPVESLDDTEAMEAPAVSVPMLADIPTIVPVDAFVQPLDMTPVLANDPNAIRLSAIPVNIARGSGSIAKLGKIFDVSQLDRQPQALFQGAPIFPPELKTEYVEAVVMLEFIINSQGEVLMPRCISSPHRRFEEAAINGVLKWKFKPGNKGGRPVNTRVQIAIKFRVSKDD